MPNVEIKKERGIKWNAEISVEIARIIAGALSIANSRPAAKDVSVRIADFNEYDYYDMPVEVTIDVNDRIELYESRDVIRREIVGKIKDKQLIGVPFSVRLRFFKMSITFSSN